MTNPRAGMASSIVFSFLVAACGGGGGSGPAASSDAPDDGPVSDTDPDSFIIADIDIAVIRSVVESEPIAISGINEAAPISISGGEYSIDGAEFVDTSGLVSNGANVVVRVTAADDFGQSVEATLTVGRFSDTFTVTTGPEDRMPDWFGFPNIYDAALSTLFETEPVTITGINGDIAISVTDGEYSIDGGEFTQSPGTIENGQTLIFRQLSANRSLVLGAATIDVGNFSTQFLVETGRAYVSPGDYEALPACAPYVGSAQAAIKIAFLKINDAPQFDAIVDDAINNQFSVIPPFSDHFASLAFYTLDFGDGADYECRGTGTDTSDRGFECNNDLIHEEIVRQCNAGDPHGIIKIGIAESLYSATGGAIIWLPDNPGAFNNTAIHEVGHNFMLGDMYGGGYSFDGAPVVNAPPEITRRWLNLDGPGCPKWCDAAKSRAEYNQSISAACPTFTTKDQCLAFNRPAPDDCADADGDGQYDCCSWVDTPTDDYFGTSCVPVWGTEDIGLSCDTGAGCYFGADRGNAAWRPVRDREESIMFDTFAAGFDAVSSAALNDALRCCSDVNDTEASCTDFRAQFSDLLVDLLEKRRLGSCGVY